jgi:hypothetical protein
MASVCETQSWLDFPKYPWKLHGASRAGESGYSEVLVGPGSHREAHLAYLHLLNHQLVDAVI